MAAVGASSARKAMRENAAFEIAAELPLDIRRTGSALPTVEGEFEPGGEVRLHGAIEHGTFGPATAIDGSARGRAGGRHGNSGRVFELPTTVFPYSFWRKTLLDKWRFGLIESEDRSDGAGSTQSRQSRQRRLDPAKTDPLLLETQIPAQAVVAQVVVQGALLRVQAWQIAQRLPILLAPVRCEGQQGCTIHQERILGRKFPPRQRG